MAEITKVVLYKHGVGYFEREAAVSGNSEVRLAFRAEEMNDVLKSLTVYDSAGGTVSSVSYDNQKPISKLLEETSLNIPSGGGQIALLHSVRGASVVVSAGNRMVTGQVVGIDERSSVVDRAVVTSVRLSIFDEAGALHAFEIAEISSIRFLDEHLKAELKHLFETLLSATKRDTKNLKLFARGEGDRKLSISYVVECPIWKTSYRIAISEDAQEKPYLQGWALVDNPQDEDWTDVRLSLVSGLPISFTHDLYSPRYLRRKEIEVQRESAAGPVMTEGVMMMMSPMDDDGFAESDDPFGAQDYDAFDARAELMQAAPASRAAPSRAQKLASAHKVETVTQSVGQLFEYRIEQPVTVLRNQSALVPIVGSEFEGGRKILYNPEHRHENPFAVIDFKNTTGLTLEGGPLTVFEGDVYAGEAMMDTLSPDEERMIPYAVDLSVEAQLTHEAKENVVMEVAKDGVWIERKARYATARYRFHNKSDKAKSLVIDHAIEEGTLVNTPQPVSETRSYWRFALSLPPNATTDFPVKVRSQDERHLTLIGSDPQWVLTLLKSSRSRKTIKGFLDAVKVVAADMARLGEQLQKNRKRTQEIVAAQARIRENLAKLSQSHDEGRLRSRYVGQLEGQEDELGALEVEAQEIAAKHQAADDELKSLVGQLEFEQIFEER